MGFLAEVKDEILKAKFILEQDKSLAGNEEAIQKLRNALDLCTVAERLIGPVSKRSTDHLLVDTISSSLNHPTLVAEEDDENGPPTEDMP